MNEMKKKWMNWLGTPINYAYESRLDLVKRYDHPEFDGELYCQANGPGTVQRVLLLLPKQRLTAVPGIVVPFYYPEAMLGFDPENGESLPFFAGIEMMLHLVRRGYAVASADAYHLTYLPHEGDKQDFSLWRKCSEALLADHPEWTGMGKLVSDTFLLTDVLANDPRVDSNRLGIAGHSLGGKMAFYNGCLDDRISVILASDFGIRWEQSNWGDTWYWGGKLEALKQAGVDHASMMACSGSKPFCLLAGKFDTMESWDMMTAAPGYAENDGRMKIVNHATGHRPTWEALCEGYDFLDNWLK